jgi:hypothetical protein
MYKLRATQHVALFWLRTSRFFTACAIMMLTGPVLGQDITLISRDGAVELSGNLLGFDGEYYRIDTVYGELTVDGSGVRCEGPACPSLEDFVARLSLSGAASMADLLLPALVEGFALREGYGFRRETLDDTHFEYLLFDRQPGATWGVSGFERPIQTKVLRIFWRMRPISRCHCARFDPTRCSVHARRGLAI